MQLLINDFIEEVFSQSTSGVILFVAFFILYGLEFLIPLVRKRSNHIISNLSFTLVLTIINLLFTSITFFTAGWADRHHAGIFNMIVVNAWWAIFISIIFLDFWAGYFVHYIFHQYEWLWRLHSVHHTDELVDVTTTFRQHPIESIIRILFQLSGMVILGIPVWILLIYLTLSTINSQIEHANIRIPSKLDKFLQYLFVTPNMHKIHHSRDQHETDSNYSNIFSVWDKLFGTYKKRVNYTTINYGLDLPHYNKPLNFWSLIKLPFHKKSN